MGRSEKRAVWRRGEDKESGEDSHEVVTTNEDSTEAEDGDTKCHVCTEHDSDGKKE